MNKILLVGDGLNSNLNTLDFACYLAKLTHSRLFAIIVEELVAERETAPKQMEGANVLESVPNPGLTEGKDRSFHPYKNESLFEMACSNRGVNAKIIRVNEPSVSSIIEESRYADLLIINADASFQGRPEGTPSPFVKEILAGSECAVVLAPYSFYGVDEILFTYDGSKSSVYAIKQFAYLFPELKDRKATIMQINEDDSAAAFEITKVRELLKSHFSNLDFQFLKGKPADELFGFLLGKKNLFVVMGAFGRGLLSNLLKPSAANLVVKAINLPVFIAHLQ